MDSFKTEKIRMNRQGDVFITKTATKTLTNPKVVEKVMNFHFRDLLKAFHEYSTIEISGFGKFEISQNKLKRRIREIDSFIKNLTKQVDTGIYQRDEEQTKIRLASMEKERAFLESRKTLDETKFEGYCRRMAQSLNATSKAEGADRTDQ